MGSKPTINPELIRAISRPAALLPTLPREIDISSSKTAAVMFERIDELLKKAHGELVGDQRLIVLYFDRAGRPIVVRTLGYFNPTLIIVWGVEPEGAEVQVYVPIESFELVVEVVEDQPDLPKAPIGFVRSHSD
jgi:hypothetical protein